MNLPRRVTEPTLHSADAPVRHTAFRRRLRTVVQEKMTKATRPIHHAGRWVLGLRHHDTGASIFARHHPELVKV